MYSINNFWT